MINLQNSFNQTALHYAANYDNNAVKLLLKYKIDPSLVDKKGVKAFAYVTNKTNYNLLKSYTNSYSTSQAKCNVFVGKQGDKTYQHFCMDVAKKESIEELKVYYTFLGGGFNLLEKIGVAQTKECQFNTLRDLGFFWVYKQDFKKAKKFFNAFILHAMSNHRINYPIIKEFIYRDLNVFKNLYGKEFEQNTIKALGKIDKFFLPK